MKYYVYYNDKADAHTCFGPVVLEDEAQVRSLIDTGLNSGSGMTIENYTVVHGGALRLQTRNVTTKETMLFGHADD